jgi:hypothetical protein
VAPIADGVERLAPGIPSQIPVTRCARRFFISFLHPAFVFALSLPSRAIPKIQPAVSGG